MQTLVGLLDGYTLLVEQVALYLALNAEVRPEALLDGFRRQGWTEGDALHAYDSRLDGAVRHREKLFVVVLDRTLRTLDGLPLASAALEVAAWLPPEHVSWAWLEAMLREDDPQAFDVPAHVPSPWHRAAQRLRSAQLLVDAGGGVARLHWLVGDHLRRSAMRTAPEGTMPEAAPRVDRFATQRAFAVEEAYYDAPTRWQADHLAVRELALHALITRPEDGTVGLWADIAAGVEQSHGSLAAAGDLIAAAMRCRERAAVLADDDPDAKRALCVSLNKLADFLLARGQSGDAEAALRHLERSLELREALHRDNPGSAQAVCDVSVSLDKLADFLLARGQRGDAQAALRHLERCHELLEALHRDNPGSAQAARDVSVSLDKLADFLLARGQGGDAETALRHLGHSLELREALHRDNPGSAQAARDLAVSLERKAKVLKIDPARLPEALACQRRSLELMRTVALDGAGTNYFGIRSLAVSMWLCAQIESEAGLGDDAAQRLGELTRLLSGWRERGGALDAAMSSLLEQLESVGKP